MKHHFFDQEAPKARMRPNAGGGRAECAASGRGFGRGKPEIDVRNLVQGDRLEGQEDLDRMIQHAVPGWAADRFAHSAGPGRNISLYSGPILRPSAPRGRQLGTKKAKMGPTTRPVGVQRRQSICLNLSGCLSHKPKNTSGSEVVDEWTMRIDND